jgi:HEAT repeat protein
VTRKILGLWLIVGALATVSSQASGSDALLPATRGGIARKSKATWRDARTFLIDCLFPARREAADLVADAVSDETVRAQLLADIALGELEAKAEDVADELGKALSDKDACVRGWSAVALGWIGSDAAEAVPLLIDALQDRDWEVRSAAAMALGRIGPDANAAAPALIGTFSRYNHRSMLTTILCYRAAKALSRIGSDALSQLLQALRAPSKRTREFAAYALGEMGEGATGAVPALIRVLERDPWWPARKNAARALGKLVTCDDEAVRALTEALQEPVMFVREAAAMALAELGPQAEDAAPVLEKALEDKMYDSLRVKFAVALSSITHDAGPGIPVINDIMSRSGHHTKMVTADVLPIAPELGASAVPALKSALGEKKRWLRVRAAMALWRSTGESDAAIEVLTPIVTASYASARETSARRLGEIGPEARSAVPALMEALQYEDPAVKDASTEALRNILVDRRAAAKSP